MTTRREFLQAGIAASAIPLGAAALKAAVSPDTELAGSSTSPDAAMSFYKVVFDERFPDCVAFAAEMRRLGAVVHAIRGDMTDLWYRDLHHQWQTVPTAIAGMTGHGAMFCLERLAWDRQMRVVFRAEHRYGTDACVEHAVSAPDVMLQDAAGLGDAGSNWSVVAAGLVHRCAQRGAQASQTVVTRLAQPAPDDQEPLFSWVIAPVVRA